MASLSCVGTSCVLSSMPRRNLNARRKPIFISCNEKSLIRRDHSCLFSGLKVQRTQKTCRNFEACSFPERSEDFVYLSLIAAGSTLGSFALLRAYIYLRLEFITTAMLGRFVPRGGTRVVDISDTVGRHLYYFPKDVVQVTVPNYKGNKSLLESQAIEATIPITVRTGDVTDFELLQESADAVVSVDALCKVSTDKVPLVLKQISKVLKPGQPFIFIESCLAPEGPLRSIQLAWWSLLSAVGQGSRSTIDLADVIKECGELEVLQIDLATGFQDPHIVGVALKAAARDSTKKPGYKAKLNKKFGRI